MIKAILLADDIVYIAIIIGLTLYALSLRKRMRGLNEPELWLPKKERQAHARKLLKREDEQYQEQMLQHFTEVIQGNLPHLAEKEGNE
jgi:hypothetical protein